MLLSSRDGIFGLKRQDGIRNPLRDPISSEPPRVALAGVPRRSSGPYANVGNQDNRRAQTIRPAVHGISRAVSRAMCREIPYQPDT
jgi:hypothetical protein